MKTSFLGSRSSCRANHSRCCCCTSGRCCSSACAVFFECHPVTVEETPQHRDRETVTAIGDQALLDFEQRDVRRAADQAQQIVTLRLDPAGAAIAACRRRRNSPRGFEALHPTHGARDTHTETLGRRVARQAALENCLDHALAKINGKPHARRLLHAARIMNQKLPDSGIPIRFNPLGYRSSDIRINLVPWCSACDRSLRSPCASSVSRRARSGLDAFEGEQIAEHPAACERIIQMQFVYPAHHGKIVNSPIFACSTFKSTVGPLEPALASDPNTPAAPCRSCAFHSVIWLTGTSNCCANSTSVFSPFMAANATFALNAGLWFRRTRFAIGSPEPQPFWPLSGRKSLIALFKFAEPPLHTPASPPCSG